jgi:hypothetical protein
MELAPPAVVRAANDLHHTYAAAAMTALLTLDRSMDPAALAREAHHIAGQMIDAYAVAMQGAVA